MNAFSPSAATASSLKPAVLLSSAFYISPSDDGVEDVHTTVATGESTGDTMRVNFRAGESVGDASLLGDADLDGGVL